jgi:phosphonate degradation associated HDIG domain protein
LAVADEVFTIFSEKGAGSYFGEPVSQLEHALQAASFAQGENAPMHLIVAALLHDIGHLVEDIPEETADLGIDARHEEIGQEWLRKRFGAEIYEPVHLHVAAKRYLCATDEQYLAKLSPASVQSLKLQGGVMSCNEIADFQKHDFYKEAVMLRRWDDQAKIPGCLTPELATYRKAIEAAAKRL